MRNFLGIDYCTFGSPMPGRSYQSTSYRYGFNGKENDPEANSTGSGTQDYGMRIYNPSLGRFLSVDPLTKNYAFLTPYAFAENDVVRSVDLDGKEKYIVTYRLDANGVTNVTVAWNVIPGANGQPGTIVNDNQLNNGGGPNAVYRQYQFADGTISATAPVGAEIIIPDDPTKLNDVEQLVATTQGQEQVDPSTGFAGGVQRGAGQANGPRFEAHTKSASFSTDNFGDPNKGDLAKNAIESYDELQKKYPGASIDIVTVYFKTEADKTKYGTAAKDGITAKCPTAKVQCVVDPTYINDYKRVGLKAVAAIKIEMVDPAPRPAPLPKPADK